MHVHVSHAGAAATASILMASDQGGEATFQRNIQLVGRILSVPLVSNLSQTSALKNTVLIRDKQLTRAKKERTASDEGRPWIYLAVSRSVLIFAKRGAAHPVASGVWLTCLTH